jgi:hypothetical protein
LSNYSDRGRQGEVQTGFHRPELSNIKDNEPVFTGLNRSTPSGFHRPEPTGFHRPLPGETGFRRPEPAGSGFQRPELAGTSFPLINTMTGSRETSFNHGKSSFSKNHKPDSFQMGFYRQRESLTESEQSQSSAYDPEFPTDYNQSQYPRVNFDQLEQILSNVKQSSAFRELDSRRLDRTENEARGSREGSLRRDYKDEADKFRSSYRY